MENEITPPAGPIKANRVEPAQKTYFFRRWDGKLLVVGEREASDIIKNRQNIVGLYVPPPKYLGCSDGRKFQQAVIEAHQLNAEGRWDEAKARLRAGEEEELAAALTNPNEKPRDFTVVDKNSSPSRISGNISI